MCDRADNKSAGMGGPGLGLHRKTPGPASQGLYMADKGTLARAPPIRVVPEWRPELRWGCKYMNTNAGLCSHPGSAVLQLSIM